MARRRDQLPTWLRQESVWRCVEHLAAGRLPPAPLAVELHLGTECNLTCPECVARPALGTTRFDAPRAESMARELVGRRVRSVVLSGGGEPLLHPSAGTVLRLLAEGGVAVGLVTNGTLIHDHLDAVADHADRVWVSVDAGTSRTHARFRPHRSGAEVFPTIVRNLETLAARPGRGRLTFSFLLLTRVRPTTSAPTSNVGEIAAAARLAREVGCDSFEVNLAVDREMRFDPAHRTIASVLSAQIEAAIALDDGSFRVFVSPDVSGLAATGELGDLPRRDYDRCPAAQVRALVNPLGVFLCPRHQDLAEARYGDPITTSLARIWGSPEHHEALQRIDPSQRCHNACMSLGFNEMLEKAIDHAADPSFCPELTGDDDLFM